MGIPNTIKVKQRIQNPNNDGAYDYLYPYTASDVVEYDNTISGLSSINTQDAIDEISLELNSLELTANAVSYDNATSGLSALTVQAAINEVQLEKAPIANPTLTGNVVLPSTTTYNGSLLSTQLNNKLNISGGTLTGIVTANSNTSYTTKQVRNIIISTEDAVLANMANGDIWIKV